jgi:hypothetical protein
VFAERRQLANGQVTTEKVLGMKSKSKDFVVKGAEVYSATQVGYTPF